MKLKISIIILICSLIFVGCNIDQEQEVKTVPDEPVKAIEDVKYADDNIINQFIINFSNIAGYELTNIKKGNIRTKYHCYANDIYVELLNATETVSKTFNISYSFSSQIQEFRYLTNDEIYGFLTDCLKTLGASENDILKTINDLTINNKGNYMKNNYEVNNSITLNYYPTKELSNHISIGHIEIVSTEFGK